MKHNLLEGNVEKLVIKTAVPMVVAQLVNMLYNIVDRIFVGKIPEIGAVALGGIGIYLPINILLMAVSLLFGAGGAPQAAIAMGKGERNKAEKYLGCCVFPIIASGILFSLLLFFGGKSILPLFGATETNLQYAVEYVNIICIGIPFSMLITGLNPFINTQGKTFIGMVSVSGTLIRVYILGMILSGIQSTMVQAFSARGMRKYSLIISLLCKGLYVPLLLILPAFVPSKYSLMAIYAAQAITDVVSIVISLGLYRRTEARSITQK